MRVQCCDLKHPVEMIKDMGGGEINSRDEVESIGKKIIVLNIMQNSKATVKERVFRGCSAFSVRLPLGRSPPSGPAWGSRGVVFPGKSHSVAALGLWVRRGPHGCSTRFPGRGRGSPRLLVHCVPAAVGRVTRSVGCQPDWRALESHFIDILFSLRGS